MVSAPHHAEIKKKVKAKLNTFLTSVPGGEWSALHFGFFNPSAHSTEGCAYPKNVVVKRTLPPL